MREDILAGKYADPFELDSFAESNISDYESDILDLYEHDLKENYNKYYRKKKVNQNIDEDEDEDDLDHRYESQRKMRRVEFGSEPWDEDQSFIWPDYEAEAFENALDQFRQRPESNTGYLNKKLNQIMRDRWGQSQADKCINDTLFKKKNVKESIQNRFQRKLNEDAWLNNQEGVLEIKVNGKWEAVGIDKDAKEGWSTKVPGKVYNNEKQAKTSGLYRRLVNAGYEEAKKTLRFTSSNKY